MFVWVNCQRRLRAAFVFLMVLSVALLSACGDDVSTPAPTEEAPIADIASTAFACGAPSTPIARLPRDASEVRQQLDPVVVDVEAVVVGNFQGGLGGFFLQSADGDVDGDPATPEGVFVEYRGETPPSRVGRRLRVRGVWSASDDATRAELAVRRVSAVIDCGMATVPTAVPLHEPPADWSRYQGMRVRAPGPLTLTGNENLLRYGELWLTFGERLVAPTEIVLPGGAAEVRATEDGRRLLIVDDGRGGEYPRRLWQLRRAPGANAPYRTGSLVSDIEGVLDRRFGSWRVQLTTPLGRVEQAPRPPAPRRDSAQMRVASFNVLNFFNGDGDDGGFPTARGAGSRNDMHRQRDKLVAALLALDADVYALMELENDGYSADSAVAELAGALTAARGESMRIGEGDATAPCYVHLDANLRSLGNDAIAVGLIYRADRVQPVGPALHLDDKPFDDDSRVPLAQAFVLSQYGGAQPVLVVANHFKSKGCGDADAANADLGDGQSCFAAVRSESARRLYEWLRDMPSGLEQTLILGDLNAHTREDPVRLLVGRGFVDVLERQGGSESYSYVFAGRAGRLDHALAGSALAQRVKAVGIWHINADELPEFDYDGDARSGRRLYNADPYRSSDHDPVWVDITP